MPINPQHTESRDPTPPHAIGSGAPTPARSGHLPASVGRPSETGNPARYSEEQVLSILIRLDSGEGPVAVSRSTGIHRRTIQRWQAIFCCPVTER
ncbi:hypothetical protein IHN32_06790 [Deinococcus sp. 14RED07]|uniref:hypothetical protein n=1 Tax=Deinococcus sp. 14RED07 TaxID=2745874 RepID=UPI001E4E0CCE|nr:hypothetical protein [Deinococcus sp. 14RED07]MCD0175653.1 hypothetical protein [Deinococcus sp. 14RED07]